MPPKRYSAKRSSQVAPSQSQSQAPRASQAAPRASQASGSLTQRRRRVIEEEEDEDEEAEAEQEDGGDGEDGDGGEAELERRIALLVRLALSVEHTRGSLRREQINKVVFPNGGRAFNTVLLGANHNLRKVFGLELVELMTRAEREKVGAGGGNDEDEEGRTGRKKNKAGASSKTYILRSALDPALVALANKLDPDLNTAGDLDLERLSSKNKTVNPDEEETVAAASRAGTSILGWDVGGEGEGDWYNVMCIILGLILVNGRSVADNTLRGLLKPLGLAPNAEMFLPISNHRRRMKFPDFLTHLTKLGYLERVRAATAMAATQQAKKRGRQSQVTGDDEEDGAATEWKWGSRAHAELGEKAVAEFMVEFMVERAIKDAARQLRRNAQTQGGDEEEDEDEENVGRAERNEREKDKAALEARAEKMREAMMRDVERSAGGHLSDAGKGVAAG
ncbi:unnamed protein product [Rhizoctonia solani]|uniref:MAGE domain-containing protein n=1 Tax=Rhizoctonia solani TaxID=456999 RepID=A0A8H3HBS0_9AGAM|nr:unnamed protein product [Rhizoctonia solani]